MTKEFASLAEARAHFYRLGFAENRINDDMLKVEKPGDILAGQFLIMKTGFLRVQVIAL
jgi:hypothetical protein